MKKEIFIGIFKKHNGQNFIIETDCAKGLGINGVDFKTFVGKKLKERERSYDPSITEEATIVSVEDEYIEIHQTITNHYTSNKGNVVKMDGNIIIPFECIKSLTFVNIDIEDSWKTIPKDIKPNKLFK